jgi:hypothetical protein
MTQTNVLESIKSEKQVLYEEYILDSEGRLRLYSPVVQSLIFSILEKAGLEAAVKAHDKETKKKEKEA